MIVARSQVSSLQLCKMQLWALLRVHHRLQSKLPQFQLAHPNKLLPLLLQHLCLQLLITMMALRKRMTKSATSTVLTAMAKMAQGVLRKKMVQTMPRRMKRIQEVERRTITQIMLRVRPPMMPRMTQ